MDLIPKENLARFESLVAIAFADGVLDPIEEEFLKQKQKDLNISDSCYKEVVSQGKANKLNIPSSYEDKEEQLIDMIEMAMIDGRLDPQEYTFILIVAELLDFSRNEVDALFKLSTPVRPEAYFKMIGLDIEQVVNSTLNMRTELLSA